MQLDWPIVPRLKHEALVHLVRDSPGMVIALLREVLGIGLPLTARPRPTSAEIIDLDLAEYRADGVYTVGDPPTAAYVIEAQGAIKPSKRRAWLMYTAGLFARYGCPVMLVVIAPDPKVARWARRPIDLGFKRFILQPVVLGPDQIPVIRDLEAARRSPELAVLSVAAHGHEPEAEHIAVAALGAARDLDSPRALLYADFIHALLGKVARAALEKLMNIEDYEYQSDFARKYYFRGVRKGKAEGKREGKAEGKAEGIAESLLTILTLKGLVPDVELRARVSACSDIPQLERWLAQALTATRLTDVFG